MIRLSKAIHKDFKDEVPLPGDSQWAELRESQTKTQNAVKNGGQAVIIDIGEASDIHPKNKRDVAERLARAALDRPAAAHCARRRTAR